MTTSNQSPTPPDAKGGKPRRRGQKVLISCTSGGMSGIATTRPPHQTADDYAATTLRNLKRLIAALQQKEREIEDVLNVPADADSEQDA